MCVYVLFIPMIFKELIKLCQEKWFICTYINELYIFYMYIYQAINFLIMLDFQFLIIDEENDGVTFVVRFPIFVVTPRSSFTVMPSSSSASPSSAQHRRHRRATKILHPPSTLPSFDSPYNLYQVNNNNKYNNNETITKTQVLEYSIHIPSRALLRSIRHTFPNAPSTSTLLVIPTFQPTTCDMLDINEETEQEKDRCLHRFYRFAKHLCQQVHAREGLWADFCDPVSGLPFFGDGAAVYSDVDGIQTVLGYSVDDYSGCRVVKHPHWGSAVYPATVFVSCPDPDPTTAETNNRVPGEDAVCNRMLNFLVAIINNQKEKDVE
eukprot:gb/GECH01009912.1/.p1 GENE.gb/GECH01009912.1/~~gb/GECH01009912.1/.p1  ORF type:complete len:322 (+),score=28.57 gb/GECH01009912.1/:1-966(+)